MEESTNSFKDKIFTEVIGPDVRGRVKTYGAGATPRTVFGTGARMQIGSSKCTEMEQRIVEKVSEKISAEFASLLDSRIAEVINLFRSGLEGESRQVGDGPSSVGNQVTNINIALKFLTKKFRMLLKF